MLAFQFSRENRGQLLRMANNLRAVDVALLGCKK